MEEGCHSKTLQKELPSVCSHVLCHLLQLVILWTTKITNIFPTHTCIQTYLSSLSCTRTHTHTTHTQILTHSHTQYSSEMLGNIVPDMTQPPPSWKHSSHHYPHSWDVLPSIPISPSPGIPAPPSCGLPFLPLPSSSQLHVGRGWST